MIEKSNHITKVIKIQNLIRSAGTSGKKVKIYHGHTNSTRRQDFSDKVILDVSNLNHILEVDVENEHVVVEPNVSMAELYDAVSKYNMIPQIMMEFPGITVGGAIQGGAAESSSFRYGAFHDSCKEYEVVLGNGNIVTASKSDNSDLFREIACSYGTLGVITKVIIKLIPAKPFVLLTYHKVNSIKEALSKIEELKLSDTDFIDGIMYSSKEGLIMAGKLSDITNIKRTAFHKPTDEWFYLQAQKMLFTDKPRTQLIPTKDYLFRYDRGAFWMGIYAFRFLKIPYNSLSRKLLSVFCTTQHLYKQLHSANLSQRFVIQDVCLPLENIEPFLSFVNNELLIFPLWLLPIASSFSRPSIFSPISNIKKAYINVGIWGEVTDYDKNIKINRLIESQVKKFHGRKTLYAHSYYSLNEFWNIYDKDEYTNLRTKYSAEKVFLNITEKVLVNEKYSVSVGSALKKLHKTKLSISD